MRRLKDSVYDKIYDIENKSRFDLEELVIWIICALPWIIVIGGLVYRDIKGI